MNLKERFEIDTANKPVNGFQVLVTLVKLPTGAIEVITNTNKLDSKIDYLQGAYDDDFKLNNNPNVQIVEYTIY